MNDRLDLLFVYGSLMRAAGNRWSEELWQGSTDLGPGTTPGRLYDLGSYPGMKLAQSVQDVVHGEVLRIHDFRRILRRLDDYEGRDYRRAVVPVTLWTGDLIETWCYVYTGEVDENRRIRRGRWATAAGTK